MQVKAGARDLDRGMHGERDHSAVEGCAQDSGSAAGDGGEGLVDVVEDVVDVLDADRQADEFGGDASRIEFVVGEL